MTKAQKIWLSLASVHFALVLVGACHKHLNEYGWWGRLLATYAAYSGAGSGYGFFAPGVGSSLRARFHLEDSKGNLQEAKLQTGSTHEFDLRVSNIIDTFFDEISDVETRRSLAASLAGKVLGRYPNYYKVRVELQSYEIPLMGEYVAGERGRWVPFYEVQFELDPEKTSR